MKITHISVNEFSGGAARAAFRLNRGLQQLQHDSRLYVQRNESFDLQTYAYVPPSSPSAKLQIAAKTAYLRLTGPHPLGWKETEYDVFSDDRSPQGAFVLEQLPPTDIINLHWVSGFLDLGLFFETTSVPVVWTLHDMNAFTGGCHYDSGCGRYKQQCGRCPQLRSDKEQDWSRSIWLRKRNAYNGHHQLTIVAPSQWLAACARQSALLASYPIHVIPYGLDTEIFKPHPQHLVRTLLGIPEQARVILFVSDVLSIQRKGFAHLLQALEQIPEDLNVRLVSVGKAVPELAVKVPHQHLGPVLNEYFLSMVYSAADIFVIPSLQDNLPNTVLEAIACGTPVVGFDTGGIPDMVHSHKTGLLAPNQDVRTLREAILKLLRDNELRQKMAVRCRQLALQEYALHIQAQRYVSLYESLLATP